MSIDTKTAAALADKSVVKSGTITCNLHNPTRARRIIYDGIEGSMKTITVEAGETKSNVTLSRAIAEELRDCNRAKKDSDLKVMPISDTAAEKTVAA